MLCERVASQWSAVRPAERGSCGLYLNKGRSQARRTVNSLILRLQTVHACPAEPARVRSPLLPKSMLCQSLPPGWHVYSGADLRGRRETTGDSIHSLWGLSSMLTRSLNAPQHTDDEKKQPDNDFITHLLHATFTLKGLWTQIHEHVT